MRVLSLFPSLDPARGGTQSGGVNMLLASQRAGVENVVAVPERESTRSRSRVLIGALEEAGVVVHTFAPLERPAEVADRWSISIPAARWIARNVARYDAIHVHGIWGLGLMTGLVAARRSGIPLLVTAHESLTAYDIDDSRSVARRAQKLLLKSLYLRWTRLFVLTSELEASDSLPPEAPRRVIHYPLFNRGEELAQPTPKGARPELVVGFVGRFDPKKNLDVLIESLTRLPPHIRLVVAGDGPPEIVAEMHGHADAMGVAERVEWLGFVSAPDRGALLDSLDVLAMPSRFESFGMSAAEAMLRGVPVLVSERTGVAEVIARHGGGIVVPPTSEGVAASIAELDRDRAQLDALGRAGQEAITQELDFERIGAQLRAAYESALAP